MQNTEAHAQSPFAARIVIALTPELGPHTASQVLRLVCERAGKTAVTLEAGDLSAAQEVVGRMLRTLL